MKQTDVIIIGGGISGLLSARELAKGGARVAVFDRQAMGRESSWAGGGILSPLCPWKSPEPITTLCGWSQAVYPVLAEELKESAGIDPEWLPSGLLYSDCDEPEQARIWAQAHAVRCDFLSTAELERLEPELRVVPSSPILLPEIAQVRNPRLLRALKNDLKQRGVELLERCPVDIVGVEKGRIYGVACGAETYAAEAYVLAAGAWSGLLSQRFGLANMPIFPVKGEMLIFAAPPGLLKHIVLSKGRYLIPRKDGKILAGSTVENAQFNKSSTEAARKTLQDFAHELLPPLRRYPIEKHWAGLRPGSPDGIPVIGPHPEIANLFFNCGHFRNGFVMAPASARLLADHVLRREPIVSPGPYLPKKEYTQNRQLNDSTTRSP